MTMADRCCDGIPIEGPDETGVLRRFGVEGFAALWHHQRVMAADLAEDPRVIPTLTSAGRLEVDDEGVLIAVHGLAARPTRHRIEHTGGTIHTWCALDAIGIPAALAITADAITSCAKCGTELHVHLDEGVPSPRANLVLWLPEVACDHLVDDFCRHANLYCSHEHLSAVVPETAVGRSITVNEVADIGRHTWADAARVVAS